MEKTAQEIATINVNGKTLELPITTGTEHEKGVDISRLRAATGVVPLDPGFANTGSCTSAITFLDGEKGVLRYRGIPIEELAEYATYSETAYLLIYGELPTQKQLSAFTQDLISRSALPNGSARLIQAFPKDIHPMAAISSMTGSLAGYYPQMIGANPTSEEMDTIIRTLIGQLFSMSAANYRHQQGKRIVPSNTQLSPVHNFLHMFFDQDNPDDDIVRAFRQILILHADHEQNCSTSTVRLVGSSRANAFAAVSAGMGALWGPLHGGANQAVIEMLEGIQKAGGDYDKYIAMAKDKQSGFRLMGFGHRVYKNFDPRAKILKSACDKVLRKLGVSDPLLDIAKHLEEKALCDDYFVSRKLYPNVDFYSGIILRAIGIPTDQFTVIFALGRLPGWLAHWKEMLESPEFRIGRPRQVYSGPALRKFVPLNQRD